MPYVACPQCCAINYVSRSWARLCQACPSCDRPMMTTAAAASGSVHPVPTPLVESRGGISAKYRQEQQAVSRVGGRCAASISMHASHHDVIVDASIEDPGSHTSG